MTPISQIVLERFRAEGLDNFDCTGNNGDKGPKDMEQFLLETISLTLDAAIAEGKKMRIDFAAMPKEKRLAMDDADMGFMHGKNCTLDEYIQKLSALKGREI